MRYLSAAARRVLAVAAAVAVTGAGATSAAFAATSSPPARAAAAIPRCTAGPDGLGLGVWLPPDQGNGAAGTIYYPLEFTNFSGHTCYLRGFPGVSAIDRDGRQLGSPARWETFAPFGTPNTVILAPGATAHAMFAYHDAVIFTSPGCQAVSAASELRVYPPGERTAAHALFGFQVCTHPGPVYLSVGPSPAWAASPATASARRRPAGCGRAGRPAAPIRSHHPALARTPVSAAWSSPPSSV